jgi:hypothetical protein
MLLMNQTVRRNHYPQMLTVKLKHDRAIHLDSYFVGRAYAGLLEGRPNVEMMKRELTESRSIATKLWPRVPSVTLGFDTIMKKNDPMLPRHFCCGLFVSYEPARNTEMIASQLAIVWYQNEFPPLADDSSMELFRELDWESLAADFDY